MKIMAKLLSAAACHGVQPVSLVLNLAPNSHEDLLQQLSDIRVMQTRMVLRKDRDCPTRHPLPCLQHSTKRESCAY